MPEDEYLKRLPRRSLPASPPEGPKVSFFPPARAADTESLVPIAAATIESRRAGEVQRELRLRTRQEEERWTRRWQAAAERLRATPVARPSAAAPAAPPTRPSAPPPPGRLEPRVPLRPFGNDTAARRSPSIRDLGHVAPGVPPAPAPIPVPLAHAGAGPLAPPVSGRELLAPPAWDKTAAPVAVPRFPEVRSRAVLPPQVGNADEIASRIGSTLGVTGVDPGLGRRSPQTAAVAEPLVACPPGCDPRHPAPPEIWKLFLASSEPAIRASLAPLAPPVPHADRPIESVGFVEAYAARIASATALLTECLSQTEALALPGELPAHDADSLNPPVQIREDEAPSEPILAPFRESEAPSEPISVAARTEPRPSRSEGPGRGPAPTEDAPDLSPSGETDSQGIDDLAFVADTEQGRIASWAGVDLISNVTAAGVYSPSDTESALPPARPSARRVRRPPPQRAPSARPGLPRESEPSPYPGPASQPDQERAREREGPRQFGGGGAGAGTVRLPTAREILAAHRTARPATAAARPAPRQQAGPEPLPTQSREPAAWRIPLVLGWIPAMGAALLLSGAGLYGAWTWAIDADHSGVVAMHLARSGAKADPLPPWVSPPDPKWWKTTSGHLTLWALWLDRTATDYAAVGQVRDLLAAVAEASPLEARARFARARLVPDAGIGSGSGSGGGAEPPSSLGLSRDVLPLAWTGHCLLASGKKEAAARAYRAALDLASRAEVRRLAEPVFSDDAQVRRYALPAEELIGPIVRDMADATQWSYAEWSAALPPAAVVRLAAARVLRERASPDAEAALDAAIAAGGTAALPRGPAAAVQIAAGAEALALKQRWSEADERYRRAIEMMPDSTIKRSWWLNLADIALRQNDESSRQKALEAARGNDPNEEVTRRAVELLKDYGGRNGRGDRRSPEGFTANALQ